MSLFDYLPHEWRKFLEVSQFSALERVISRWYNDRSSKILPVKSDVFRAFQLCALDNVKVIILGQAAGQVDCPRSHMGEGWEAFTGHVINKLLSEKKNLVFMRWGKAAEAVKVPPKAYQHHLILSAAYPSRPAFEGCNHFAACNKYLSQHGQAPIRWT